MKVLKFSREFKQVIEPLIHQALKHPLHKFAANRPYTAHKNKIASDHFCRAIAAHAATYFTKYKISHWRGIIQHHSTRKHVMIDVTRRPTATYRATVKLTAIHTDIIKNLR